MLRASSAEAVGKLDIVTTGKTFEQGLTDLLTSLFHVVGEYEETNDQASSVIDNMQDFNIQSIGTDGYLQKLLKLTTGVGEDEMKRVKGDEGDVFRNLKLFVEDRPT
jgi:hypothetical protein